MFSAILYLLIPSMSSVPCQMSHASPTSNFCSASLFFFSEKGSTRCLGHIVWFCQKWKINNTAQNDEPASVDKQAPLDITHGNHSFPSSTRCGLSLPMGDRSRPFAAAAPRGCHGRGEENHLVHAVMSLPAVFSMTRFSALRMKGVSTRFALCLMGESKNR